MNRELEKRDNSKTRHLSLRLMFAAVWFVVIYWIVSMAIGAIVGVFATGPAESEQAAYDAAYAASLDFSDRYGIIVLLSVFTLCVTLFWYELLPKTSTSKGADGTIRSRWFAAPKRVRTALDWLISLTAAFIVGFAMTLLGGHGVFTTITSMVIGAAIFDALNRNDK